MKRGLFIIIFLTTLLSSFAQVAVNTDGSQPNSHSVLDVKSTDKGMLTPRMTTTQRTNFGNTLGDSEKGMMVYDTDENSFYYFSGSAWTKITSGTILWNGTGNYIYSSSDSVGIGTNSPASALEVNGIIKLNDASTTSPQAGMIRWDSVAGEFEGYNGSGWVSLSKTNGGWGDNSARETQVFTDSYGGIYNQLGYSVSVDGKYAAAGASGVSASRGAVYVFYRLYKKWTKQDSLSASDAASGDHFGNSVSISGDYLVVGSFYKEVNGNNHQGQAYVFKRDGTSWSEEAILTASDGSAWDYFGYNVSIDGDYIIVGAYYKTVGGHTHQGKAYIFHKESTSWNQQAELIPSDGSNWDGFGRCVSINGDYSIVGAPSKTINGHSQHGKAYIFHRNGTSWNEQTGLLSSDGGDGDNFGRSVSIDSAYAIVGADYKTIGSGGNQGKAYIFHRSGTAWSEQMGITTSDGSSTDHFGKRVSISGDYAIVGAYKKDVTGNSQQGKAYIFHRTGAVWSEETGLVSSDGAENDQFGCGVSIDGSYIVVGAQFKVVNGNTNQGKIYFFERH